MGYQDMAALSLPMYGGTIRSNNIDNSLRDAAQKRFLMPNAANWRVHLRKDADPLILRFIHRQVMGRNLDRHDIRALHKQSNFFFYGDMKNIDQRAFFLRIFNQSAGRFHRRFNISPNWIRGWIAIAPQIFTRDKTLFILTVKRYPTSHVR